MKVLKFGGTSVGTPDRMASLLELIDVKSSERKVVVLSAFSGVTNQLVEISNHISKGCAKKALKQIQLLETKFTTYTDELLSSTEAKNKATQIIDKHIGEIRGLLKMRELFCLPFTEEEKNILLAQGELVSTAILQTYMEEQGHASELIPALNFMKTDQFGEPDFTGISEALTQELSRFHEKTCFITQGFICKNYSGRMDNLKRGGSDYTATLIGAALDANEIEIWTDIDGMHNNDPRIITDGTQAIPHLSFEEAGELAYFGAKILHPSCILPAKSKNIPVRLKSTMNPQAEGTLISDKSIDRRIKAIAAKDGITAIKIKSDRMLQAYGFLRRTFEIFETYKTPIDMITTSEVAVSLTIDNDEHLNAIVKDIEQFASVEVDQDLTIVCVVGDFIAEHKGYGGEIFNSLQQVPIRMISYGGSKHNISLLINSSHKEEALSSLNSTLFSCDLQTT